MKGREREREFLNDNVFRLLFRIAGSEIPF